MRSGETLKCEIVERINANDATVYNLDVKYSYQIDGEVFGSTQIMFYFREWSSCRSYYADLQTALTTQNPLSVYVNPHNPRESMLFPGVDHVPVDLLPLSVFMMLVCPASSVIAIYVLFFA